MKFDQYDKQLREVDYDALVKKLKDLEKMVILLAGPVKEVKDPARLLDKAGALSLKSAENLTQAMAEREAEKKMKQYQKESESLIKASVAQFEKMNIDTRLKVLEGMVRGMAR